MNWLSELERSQVGLKFGSHLLETVDRQMTSGAKTSAGEWCDKPTSGVTCGLCDRR